MKIAVLVDGKNVAKDINLTKELHIYDVNNTKMVSQIKIDITEGGGYEGLLYILYNEGVETVLCGDITEEQKKDVREYDINVVEGAKGYPSKVLNSYIRYLKQQK